MNEIVKPLPQGTVLQGKNRYIIEKPLGQGTFGTTYLATLQLPGNLGSMGHKVTIKEFFMKEVNGRKGCEVTTSADKGLFIDYKKKFRTEAINLSKLNHPHIIKVLELFEANNTVYYVMEYISGGTLDDYIVRKGALSEKETLDYIRQIGSALQYLHKQHILHLDVKPSNIMRREDGTLLLIDFGLSKQYDEQGNPESSSTIGNGTPGYAPIEQSTYKREDGFCATLDIYAFGATIYKMLVGSRPRNAADILNDGFPRQQLEKLSVTKDLIDVVEKAMAPLRKDRFQTVTALLKATSTSGQFRQNEQEDTEEEGTIPIPQPRPKPEPDPDPKPKTWLWGLIGVIVIVAGIIIGVTLDRNDNAPIEEWDSICDEDLVEEEIVEFDGEEAVEAVVDRIPFEVNGVSFNMIGVDGGTFTMGATSEQGSDAYSDEKPTHQVTLSSYSIGQTEVTQALWKAVMGSNPSNWKGDNLPVERVSWNDCQAFIRKLNQLTGQNFRLPTEAEWEYAARGGNKSQGYKYAGSNSIESVAWYDGNSSNQTHNVGTKKANELGLYDMSGNVYEWCQDWYSDYSTTPQTNPQGANHGSYRISRGCGYASDAWGCRVSNRACDPPSDQYCFSGLRLVLS